MRLANVTFLIGLVLTIAAYFQDHADRIPGALRLIAPAYLNATQGLSVLASQKSLTAVDPGFTELASIFKRRLEQDNSPESLSKIDVTSIRREGAMMSFGQDRAGEVVPIVFALSNGQEIRWTASELEAQVDELRESRVFHYSIVVFLTGVALQVAAFRSDGKNVNA
jgi:hypothetical protein